MKYKEKMLVLRTRIPVGIREALDLLETTKGNVAKAEQKFKDQNIKLVIDKVGCTRAFAMIHLTKCAFDLQATFISIEDDGLTETEKAFKHNSDKIQALSRVSDLILKEAQIARTFWLDKECIQQLAGLRYVLVLITEWLDYDDCEGFENAVLFYPDLVIPAIEKELDFPELANIIAALKAVQDFVSRFCEKYRIQPSTRNRILTEHKDYERLTHFFQENRSLLIDKLYDLVLNNKNVFP